MSVIEYAVRFNELSCFTSNQVATEEMRMDHFEQGLKREMKQTIAVMYMSTQMTKLDYLLWFLVKE